MSQAVSILMPVLNEEHSIRAAIESVLCQERCDPEVLVVDGRSADQTRALVATHAAADRRVRLLDNPAVIIPAALNRALGAARADFVARVDGHAEISHDYIARALDRLAADPALGGVGGRRRGVASTRVGRAIALAVSSRFGVGNSINHYATVYQLSDHASFGVYRTEAARAVGGWDESLAVNEDVDFDHRLLRAGYRIAYDPDMIVDWQVRETLPALFRQYRRYGRGKAAMVRKNGPTAIRARHLAPPVLIVSTLLAVLLAPFWSVTLAVPGIYLAGVLLAGLAVWSRDPEREGVSLPALPAAFAATHFGWGLGFLEGLVLSRKPAVASGSTQTSVGADVCH